ncbi:MAG: hypothetical protein ACI87N_002331, partial [Flavobacteriales bacterium]
SVWETLCAFGDNPKHLGAKLGMIAVLHTWGQNLSLHPHLHCIRCFKSRVLEKRKSKRRFSVFCKSDE